MDYNKINKIDVDGDGNIILQDVNADSITINYNQSEEIKKLISLANEELLARIQEKISGKEIFREVRRMLDNFLALPPEIKILKEQIKKNVNDLHQKIRLKNGNLQEILSENSSYEFEGVNFDTIVDAIKCKNCVLFIGPEISTNKDGNSLHEEFYVRISKPTLQYNQIDGFFMPNTEGKLTNAIKLFYNEEFPKTNTNGRSLLEKLSQISFKLIIPVSPDSTINDIFETNNMNPIFSWYNGQVQDIAIDDKQDKTIIYNALGCATMDGRYIFTHKQFNDYIKIEDSKRIPTKIESIIKAEGVYYLFLGFNFNKWYYRLLMFALNIDNTKESFAFETKEKTQKIHQDYVKAQFNITFINSGYEEFASLLLHKCSEKGLSKPLDKRFIESITHELEMVTDLTFDSRTLKDLRKQQAETNEIEQKINNWLKHAGKN